MGDPLGLELWPFLGPMLSAKMQILIDEIFLTWPHGHLQGWVLVFHYWISYEKLESGYISSGGWTFCKFVDFQLFLRSVWYVWGVSEARLKRVWKAFEARLKCVWGASEKRLRCVWTAFELHLTCAWSAFEMRLRCVWGGCVRRRLTWEPDTRHRTSK